MTKNRELIKINLLGKTLVAPANLPDKQEILSRVGEISAKISQKSQDVLTKTNVLIAKSRAAVEGQLRRFS